MAKFDFFKEQWLLNDSEWVKRREQDWLIIEVMFAATRNQNELASMKNYFIKGVWTPEAKYEPTPALKLLLCPKPSLGIYENIAKGITNINKFMYFREEIIYLLCNKPAKSLMLNNRGITESLIKHIIFNQEEFTNEVNLINGHEVRVFPCEIIGGVKNNFISFYTDNLLTWLEIKDANPECGVIYLLKHWFTALKFLELSTKLHKNYLNRLYVLFLNIRNFIPSHNTNSGSLEKQSLVNQFNECVAKYGFHNEAIQQLWDKAGVDKEDAWVDKVMLNPISEDKINKQNSYEKELFRTFVAHEVPSYKVDFKQIAQVFKKYDFTNDEFSEGMVQRVRLTEHLTSKFKSELGYSDTESIYGLRYQFCVNSKYLGTDKSLLKLDLISVNKFKQETNPTFMIIERPRERNALCKSRVCLKNRQFIIDAIRAELGIQFFRYLGFTYDESNPRKIPPEPKYYDSYLEEMAEPFIDANYFPLKIGRFGLLDNEDDDFPLK